MAARITVQASDELQQQIAHATSNVTASRNASRDTCRLVGVDDAQISITWMSDAEIAELNEDEMPIGDIYIGYEQAARQAVSYGCTLQEELVRLAVHGTLHVLGFDHPYEGDRTDSVMWMLQEAIVSEVFA